MTISTVRGRMEATELLATDCTVVVFADRETSRKDSSWKEFDAFCTDVEKRLRAALEQAIAEMELGDGVRVLVL